MLKTILNELNLAIGFGKVVVNILLDCNNIEDSNCTKESLIWNKNHM